MADTMGYCRFVTVASLPTPTSPARPAPVPPTVARHTTRTSPLQFGALLAMMLYTTMAPSLMRLLPASTAKHIIAVVIVPAALPVH